MWGGCTHWPRWPQWRQWPQHKGGSGEGRNSNTQCAGECAGEGRAGVPADNLHRRISGGDPLPPSGARSRKEDVLLHRLRANRAPFLQATLHRWGKAPSPSCPHCGAPQEDTEHFVLHCPHWADIRRTHLGAPDIIDVTILQNEESGVLRFVEAAGH